MAQIEHGRRHDPKALPRKRTGTQDEDLTALPSNRLEALRGDRAGQHSIRINAQWRVCFRWTEEGPCDVEIVGCH